MAAINVKLSETDLFQEMLKLLGEVLSDQDIPESVRFKYFTRLEGLKGARNAYKDSKDKK